MLKKISFSLVLIISFSFYSVCLGHWLAYDFTVSGVPAVNYSWFFFYFEQMFGWGIYVVPTVFIVTGLIVLSIKASELNITKIILLDLLLIIFSLLIFDLLDPISLYSKEELALRNPVSIGGFFANIVNSKLIDLFPTRYDWASLWVLSILYFLVIGIVLFIFYRLLLSRRVNNANKSTSEKDNVQDSTPMASFNQKQKLSDILAKPSELDSIVPVKSGSEDYNKSSNIITKKEDNEQATNKQTIKADEIQNFNEEVSNNIKKQILKKTGVKSKSADVEVNKKIENPIKELKASKENKKKLVEDFDSESQSDILERKAQIFGKLTAEKDEEKNKMLIDYLQHNTDKVGSSKVEVKIIDEDDYKQRDQKGNVSLETAKFKDKISNNNEFDELEPHSQKIDEDLRNQVLSKQRVKLSDVFVPSNIGYSKEELAADYIGGDNQSAVIDNNNIVDTGHDIKNIDNIKAGGNSVIKEHTLELTNIHSPLPMQKFNVEDAKNIANSSVEDAKKDNDSDHQFLLPSTTFLKGGNLDNPSAHYSEQDIIDRANILLRCLSDFRITGDITAVYPGPVVTLFEFEPAAGIKLSRVVSLADDIARTMGVLSARISNVPGKTVIGIEIPNNHRDTVYLREMLESRAYTESKAMLPIALGKDISGNPVVMDLAKTPHLLIAGTTGSGKSVAINTMIMSILYRYTPDECKFIMIDPKMLELSVYNDIPHLLTPVVTDPAKAIVALKWAVAEMENRYRFMAQVGVRNIAGYNELMLEHRINNKKIRKTANVGFDEYGQPIFENIEFTNDSLPWIIIIIDEMADLMLTAGKEVEGAVQRLSQMARAAGIHVIMATQRPSADVITGVIKSNFPSRVTFQVSSATDSRVIISENGAEQLLGNGDMLYMAGGGKLQRLHGPFVSDGEISNVVNFIKKQEAPNYVDGVIQDNTSAEMEMVEKDDLYYKALDFVRQENRASTSSIQRKFQIGYNRAARIIESMEYDGVVSKPDRNGRREVIN